MTAEAMAVASACPVLPSSPCYMAQHLRGHESVEDGGGGPEPAVCARQGGLPFAGLSNLHAAGIPVLGDSMSFRAIVYGGACHDHGGKRLPNSLSPPSHSVIFSPPCLFSHQCLDSSFPLISPHESSHVCPLILCSPKVRLKQTSM